MEASEGSRNASLVYKVVSVNVHMTCLYLLIY